MSIDAKGRKAIFLSTNLELSADIQSPRDSRRCSRAPSRGVFVRLGSGTKDSALFRDHGGCARTPMMALKFLQTSPRTRAHVSRFLELGHPVHLFVRHWVRIPPWQEFRCFMRHRRLVGISQLAHWGDTPDYSLAPMAEEIARTPRDFFVRVAQASHVGSAVFDVLCDTEAGEGTPSRVWLLDANPWGPANDACLFDWSQPEGFDGSFRYLLPPNGKTPSR